MMIKKKNPELNEDLRDDSIVELCDGCWKNMKCNG